MRSTLKSLIYASAISAIAVWPMTTSASHFRGATMVPEISSSGVLTVTTTSFWRKGSATGMNPNVTGFGFMTQQSNAVDTSDARFDVRTQVFTRQLTSAGSYNIVENSCCRVAVGGRGNWSESSYIVNSGIVWDGSTATKPIDFNFGSVQPEVNRNSSYSQNLNATSPDGAVLSYNQSLNNFINFQPTPNFQINTTTGLMTIPSSETPLIVDNTNTVYGPLTGIGADAAFSGNIVAANGSFVEFDWMFDGVNQAVVNNAPVVNDGALAGVVGTVFNFLFSITDPDGNSVSFDSGVFDILGPTPAIQPVFDHLTGLLTWDSAGSALGNYIFQVRGRDSGNLTDVGSASITVNQAGVVPEPSSLLVHAGLAAIAMIGFAWGRRKLLAV